MYRTLLAIGTLLLAILLILGACSPTSTPEGTAVPEAEPAEFEVSSLAVTPIVAEPGQAVTVEVEVKNVGGTEGSHTLVLTVNGVEEETRDVTVAPSVTEKAAFALIKDTSGMYDIEVAGLTETLRVKQTGAYPRLANYYHIPTAIPRSEASSLARWDLIVVNYRLVYNSPESIQWIREQNPNIKILAWISAGLSDYWLQNISENFYLHYGDTPGNPKPPGERQVILWTSATGVVKAVGMNPASEWSTYLPDYVHDELMSSGLFDGVFYDCVWESMWLSNIDIDSDGVGDSLTVVNREYQEGMARLLQLTRELLGPEAIIFGNPGVEWSANSPYWDYANGHMQENALGTMSWSSHDFSKVWDIYQRSMQKLLPPPRIHWIAVDTNQEEFDKIKPNLSSADLQRMRFGLAITLLGDGYFGFDEGDGLHGQLWWFPEYDASLGFAAGDAQERSDGSWMREFEDGVVIANPTSKESTVEFTAIYRDVTTGVEGTSFTVPSKDGRIFVKGE